MRNPYGPDRKQCRKCGEIKPISAFRPQQARCRDCNKIRQKIANDKILDSIRASQKRYRDKNAERVRIEYAADPMKQTGNIWRAMIQRCEDHKGDNFERYGGRGIVVCERWRNSFEDFLADVGVRPSADYSIDRINTNGNYEPGNVRWATRKEQRANRRKYDYSAASKKSWILRRDRMAL